MVQENGTLASRDVRRSISLERVSVKAGASLARSDDEGVVLSYAEEEQHRQRGSRPAKPRQNLWTVEHAPW